MRTIAWILGIGLALWAIVAGVAYLSDGTARDYAETNTSTSTYVAAKPDGFNPWAAFFFGYMLGGMGESPAYRDYRHTTNNYYRESYVPPAPTEYGAWGTEQEGQVDAWGWSDDNSGSWGEDTGSWGSDWDSTDSGSWGSDSSWDSYDSGSWDSGSSWDSYDSGSWGSDWGGSSDSGGSWGE